MKPDVRAALIAIGVVAIVWTAAAATLVPLHRWFAWDEAVYFAKASPKLPTITWAPERDIGFPALLWPVVAAGGGLLATRVELLLLCGVGAFVAYTAWIGAIGAAAPAAAMLFLSSWPALFFGSELYPHMVVALAIVGAFGAASASVKTDRARPAVVGFAFAAFASCIRPTDVLLAVAAGVPVLFLLERWRARAAMIALLGGAAVGCAMWVIEAFVVFHSPIARWRDAFSNQPVRDPRRGVLLGLAHRGLDTPLRAAPVVMAVAWLVGLTLLAVAGVFVAHHRGQLSAVLPAAVAGAVVVGAYSVYWADTGARFLIPGFALVSIPAGVAVHAAWRAALTRPATLRGAAGVAICAAVAATVVLHAHAANVIATRERAVRAVDHATGVELARRAAGRPCRFVAQFNFPAVEVASGCLGKRARYDTVASLPRAFRAPRDGWVRFAVGPKPPVAGSPVAGWEPVAVRGAPGMRVYVAPEVRATGKSRG
ncbi:MAG: hypothetical protein QOI55_1432 [Actinomycetota bacterium]|nr:hypothetical protein [Actinomycetota bacterium]